MGSVFMKNAKDCSMEQAAYQCVIKEDIHGLQQLSETNDLTKIILKNHSSLLHIAGYYGCKESIRYLLKAGCDPNIEDISNETPLHSSISAKKNSVECLQLLLKHKADINARNVWLRTPLMKAIINFKYSCAKYLIKEGADVNLPDKYGTNPIHVSASYGNYELVELLIQNRANISARDAKGRTAINFSIVGNVHRDIFYKFLECNNYEDHAVDLESSVQLVITKLDMQMLNALFMAGASVRHPPIDFCLKIVQKCVKSTDDNDNEEYTRKVLSSIQCMKHLIAANGFPVSKNIRDRIGHLRNGSTNPTVLKHINDLMEFLSVVMESKTGTPDTLQNLSRRKCRCALMLSNKNVIWAASKLDVSQVAIDLCTLKL